LASENCVRFSGLTLAGPYGFGFAKNPNPIGPDPFRSLLTRFKRTEKKITENVRLILRTLIMTKSGKRKLLILKVPSIIRRKPDTNHLAASSYLR
jgi:hypothetical protein